jgi:hypothetical protein
MERDPNILKLIRESGVVSAPDGFTGKVMGLIADKADKQIYKPLIGKWGALIIFLFLVAIVTVSIIFAGPAEGNQVLGKFFAGLEWNMPQINISLDFLSTVSLPAGRLPTWIISSLAAVFILVLIDTRILKRGLF